MSTEYSQALLSLQPYFPLGKLLALAVGGFLITLASGLRLRQTMMVPPHTSDPPQPEVRKLCPASENEVIAEFLKNEFYHSDFDDVRQELAAIVLNPNLQDEEENGRRRHLLFRKRGAMWRELPADTTWWRVALTPRALGRIRVFPRADWRRYSQRGFSLPQFAARIVAGLAEVSPDPFLVSLSLLRQQLAKGSTGGSVLLIGIDEDKALTIIEGNHRMVAAALMSSPQLESFRFYCGFSPRMAHCCWYRSSVTSLLHYAGNLLLDIKQFRHSDVARIIPRRRAAAADASQVMTAEPVLQLSGTALQMTDTGLKVKDENTPSAA
ncbi:MAG TPA: hypothetical protein VKT29_15980 [Terriglobales bacterium]|nr:hypothetical protein [Terriglobales bacterium]